MLCKSIDGFTRPNTWPMERNTYYYMYIDILILL